MYTDVCDLLWGKIHNFTLLAVMSLQYFCKNVNKYIIICDMIELLKMLDGKYACAACIKFKLVQL